MEMTYIIWRLAALVLSTFLRNENLTIVQFQRHYYKYALTSALAQIHYHLYSVYRIVILYYARA